jgi:urea carboxylase-associated protein 2
MGGTLVDAMPIVPAPDGLIWDETIAGGGYTSRRIARGTRLTLTDRDGDACASILLFNAECPVERLNVADTIKVQWNAYLGPGKLLLSDMGRVMAAILMDDAQTHDAFCGASNAASHARKYGKAGNFGPHPSARERFLIAAAKYGLGRRDVHPCVTLFKAVRIDGDGVTHAELGPFPPGRSLTLRAEMDMILILANCPHVLDQRPYSVTPLRIIAAAGPATADDDAIRTASPEGLRAYLNTEDYYRR